MPACDRSEAEPCGRSEMFQRHVQFAALHGISYWNLPHICGDDGLGCNIPPIDFDSLLLLCRRSDSSRHRLPLASNLTDLRVSDDTVYYACISDAYEVIRIMKTRQRPQSIGKLVCFNTQSPSSIKYQASISP